MRLRKRFANVVLPVYKSNTARIVAWIISVLAGTAVFSIMFWGWLNNGESGSTTIRNLGLIVAAMIGLPLAIWRSKVAERQADTAQRGLLNERYQKGTEMLGSKILAVRLGGIYALGQLARVHPRDYHLQIMSLLCAFVHHHPTVEKENQNSEPDLEEDFWKIIKVIIVRSAEQIEIEKEEKYRLDLRELNLSYARILTSAELSNADLMWADLSHAHLGEANLANSNLTGANLKNCQGLTQEQIDLASADDQNPPKLKGAVDSETGKPLIWRGEGAE